MTDVITICARCRQPAVKVDVREQFSVGELVDRFAEQTLPARWAMLGDAVIEIDSRSAPTNQATGASQ